MAQCTCEFYAIKLHINVVVCPILRVVITSSVQVMTRDDEKHDVVEKLLRFPFLSLYYGPVHECLKISDFNVPVPPSKFVRFWMTL